MIDHRDNSIILCSLLCHLFLKVCLETGSAGCELYEVFPGEEMSETWEADIM